jgi:hypothetical protein
VSKNQQAITHRLGEPPLQREGRYSELERVAQLDFGGLIVACVATPTLLCSVRRNMAAGCNNSSIQRAEYTPPASVSLQERP